MPFYSRVVEPRHLGRRAGDEAALPLRHGVELRDGANRGLVGLLRQLGELSRHAEGVLAGLEEEARAVGGRAGLLAARVLALGTAVAVLDAKRVRVPVSSLEEGARQCDHYRSWRELQERMLTPETRPPCVWELHRDARSSLRAALTECDWLRGDGHPSSDLYSQGPTFASLPGGRASAREDGEGAQEHDDAAHGGLLPTPEERMRRLAQNFPPHTVAIDVSGLGFDRQATVRRSYLGGDGTLKRRHNKAGASSTSSSAVAVMSSRRRTISGFPESLQHDLASVGSELRALRGRSLYLHSAADVAAGGSGKRDSQCQTDGAVRVVAPSMRRIRAQRGHGIAALMCRPPGAGPGEDGDADSLAFKSLPRLPWCPPGHDKGALRRDVEASHLAASMPGLHDPRNGRGSPRGATSPRPHPCNSSGCSADGGETAPRQSNGPWAAATASRPRSEEMAPSKSPSLPVGVIAPQVAGRPGPNHHANLRTGSPVCRHMEEIPDPPAKDDDGGDGDRLSWSESGASVQSFEMFEPSNSETSDTNGSESTVTSGRSGPARGYRLSVQAPWPATSKCPDRLSPAPGQHWISCGGSSAHSLYGSAGGSLTGTECGSMYSVDADGFYTSMHVDCGLSRAGASGASATLATHREERRLSEGSGYSAVLHAVSLRRPRTKPPPPRRTDSLTRNFSLRQYEDVAVSPEPLPPPPDDDLLADGSEGYVSRDWFPRSPPAVPRAGDTPPLRGRQSPCGRVATSPAVDDFERVPPPLLYSLCPLTPTPGDDGYSRFEYAESWRSRGSVAGSEKSATSDSGGSAATSRTDTPCGFLAQPSGDTSGLRENCSSPSRAAPAPGHRPRPPAVPQRRSSLMTAPGDANAEEEGPPSPTSFPPPPLELLAPPPQYRSSPPLESSFAALPPPPLPSPPWSPASWAEGHAHPPDAEGNRMRDCSTTPPALQACSTPSVETLRATATASEPGMEAGGTRNGETASLKKTKPPVLPKPPSPRRYGRPFGLTAGGLREGGSPPKDEAARASQQELCGVEAPLRAPKPGGTCHPVESAARRHSAAHDAACATQESAEPSTKNDSGFSALVDRDSVMPVKHSQYQFSHITCSAIWSSKSKIHSSEMQSRTSEIHSNDLRADTPESHSGGIHSSASDIHSPDLRSCIPDIQLSGIQSSKPDIQPSKPAIQSSKPDIQPSESDIQSSKPDIQPNKPDIQPIKPDIQPIKPDIQPSKPDIQPSKPDIQSSKLDIQPSKPDIQSSKLDIQPSKPDIQSSKPDIQSSKPDIQPSKPDIQPSKPDIQSSKPDIQSSKPDIQPSKPDIQPSKPDIQPSKPDIQPSKPDIQSSKPDIQPSKPDIQPSKPDIQSSKPDIQSSKPDIQSSKPDIQSSKPDIQRSKPDIQPSKPDIQPSKPDIQPSKPDIQPSKPDVQPSKSDVQPSKPEIQSSKLQIQPRVSPDQASSLPAERKPPPPVAKKPTVSSLRLVSSSDVLPCSPSPSWPSSQASPLPVPEASPAERAPGRSPAVTADGRCSEPAGMALGFAGTPPPSPARPSTSAEFAASARQSPGAACADLGRGAGEEEEREVFSVALVDPAGGGGRGSDATDSSLRRCCSGMEARTGDEERLSQLQVVAVTAEEAVGEASEDVFTDNDVEADERWDGAEQSAGDAGALAHTPSHTRTTEDLFAAIHRSKRIHLGRHNSDDTFLRHRSMSPPVRSPGTPSPGGAPGGTRGPPARRPGRKQSTSSDDFKALLLRKGARSDVGTRMSAVEMLRSARSLNAPAGAAAPDRPEDEAEFAEADAPVRDRSRRFVSEGFSPRGGGGGFGGSPGTPPPRLGRSNTPPSAGSRRYNNRSRLHSTPMQAIREGEGEAGGDAVPS